MGTAMWVDLILQQQNDEILVRTAISGVSMEGAEKNLLAEASHEDFDRYHREAADRWNRERVRLKLKEVMLTISPISIQLCTIACWLLLFTAMWMAVIMALIKGTSNRRLGELFYLLFVGYLSCSSPLFCYFTQPQRVDDMVKSFLAFYDQNGRLPVWNFFASETDMMIGYHSVPVIVDAYMKGIGDFNAEHALEACIATANMDDYRGIGLYKSYGYIPYEEKGESVSKTLEYAFDDYCISLMAERWVKRKLPRHSASALRTTVICIIRNPDLCNP